MIEKSEDLGGTKLFETVLASMGMGAAKIDLCLDHEFVKTGEKVTGKIVVTGGKAEQKIEGLSVYFILKSVQAKSSSELTKRVAEIDVSHDEFMLKPNEQCTFPFSFNCPNHIPTSSINTRYYFDTNLEIKHAIDSHDRDYIKVLPDERIQQFLTGFKQLGFKPDWEGLITDDQGWSQLIQYHPTTYFYGVCHQIAIYFRHNLENDTIEGTLEIGENQSQDYSALIDIFHLNEKVRRFVLTKSELDTAEKAKDNLEKIVKQMLKK